jgi:hypothetical protein
MFSSLVINFYAIAFRALLSSLGLLRRFRLSVVIGGRSGNKYLGRVSDCPTPGTTAVAYSSALAGSGLRAFQ